jgi:hypothetical protein
MVIITDCCVSTPITGTVNDANRPESLKETPPIPNALTDYKGFKYDAGSWNANYFRNALNTNNIYNYPNQPRRTQIPNSDNSSLVYGKYVIINAATDGTGTVAYSAPISKKEKNITIPDTVTIEGFNYQVTEIKANALKGSKKLKKVVIGKNISKIEKSAFENCKSLKASRLKHSQKELETRL